MLNNFKFWLVFIALAAVACYFLVQLLTLVYLIADISGYIP